MGADADAGPVGRRLGVGPRVSVLDQCAEKFVDHVRVTAAVAAALHKGEVVSVLDTLGEFLDRLGQEMCEVRHLDSLGNIRLGPLGHVQDVRIVLCERPFKTFLGAVNVDALAVLPGDIVQETPDVRGKVAVLDFDVAAFDGELVAALLRDVLPHGAAAETAHVLGEAIDHPEARAHDVRRVVHGDHLLPVTRPAVHVLRMTRREVLQFAEFALVVKLLDEQKFAAVNHRLGHHVLEAGFVDGLAKLLALGDRCCHWHGAHDVLAGAQGPDGLRRVIGDRRVNVNRINLRIGQQFFVIRVALGDGELVGHGVHLRLVAPTHGDEVGVGMRLVDGNKLCAETEADEGYIKGLFAHSAYVRSHTVGCRCWVASIRSRG